MVVVAGWWGAGCTTVLYKGPARPASQIAVLLSTDTMIAKVDGLMVLDHASGNAARFEVLPGEHKMGISLHRVIPGFLTSTIQQSGYIIVCVELEAGHTYRTRPVIHGRRWLPRVIDETTKEELDPSCDDDVATPTAAAPSAARAVAPIAAVPPASGDVATPGPAAPPDGGATTVGGAAPSATAVDGTAADGGVVPPTAAAAPVEPSVDSEAPRRRPAARASRQNDEPSAAQLSNRRPGSGLSLFFGFGFGGDDFVKGTSSNGDDQTLSSGTGLLFGLGGMVTPLWAGETVGFGAGVDAAIKYDSIDASNGSASITRFPVALTAHLLTNGSGGDHFFLLKGGLIRDFGVHYSASGFASIDADVDGTWGPTGALGYYKRSNDSFAWDVMGFFALTSHTIGTAKINADSFGLTMGFHLNL
jgi:hypothetical protein